MLVLVLFALMVQCGARIRGQEYTEPAFLGDNTTRIFTPMPMGQHTEKFASIRIGRINDSCLFRINKRDVSTLLYLAENKMINIVEIHPNFASNTSIPRIQKRRWTLVNKVGREILLLYTMTSGWRWTLTVHTKIVKVDIFEHPSGCIASTKNPESYFVTIIVYQIFMSNLDREICYNGVIKNRLYHVCCTILRNHPSKSHCYVHVRSPLLSVLASMASVLILFMASGGLFVMSYFCICLPWQSANESNDYYRLTESPMSVSYILFKLFWDGYGPLKSFARRCMFIGIVFVLYLATNLFAVSRLIVLFSLWAVLLPFSTLFAKFSSEKVLESVSFAQILVDFLHSYLVYDARDIYLSSRSDLLGAVSLITLPLNIKRWKIFLIKIYSNRVAPVRASNVNHRSFCVRLEKFVFHFITIFSYILIVLIMQIIVIVTSIYVDTLFTLFMLFYKTIAARQNEDNLSLFLIIRTIHEFLFVILSGFIFIQLSLYLPTLAISFFCGIILNIVYFLPYISFLSVLTFYSLNFWKTVEERYITLKSLIHKECRSKFKNDNCDAVGIVENDNGNTMVQVSEINNGGNESKQDNNGSKTEYVVSKQLYDEIRERLLPYQWHLFFFAFKFVCIAAFASVVLTLVEILLASDTSPTVQVLTTFSVSALPYMMNMVACKSGEEEKHAWTENLQADVKHMVNKLTADNSELARITIAVPRNQFV